MSDHKSVMLEALQRQRDAFNRELPVSAEVRKDRIRRVMQLIQENAAELAAAINEDFSYRSTTWTYMSDFAGTLNHLELAISHCEEWMQPERRAANEPGCQVGAIAEIQYQPKGIVGVVAPWNYPVHLACQPLGDIFAAGNRAMIKPSEYTPKTSALMKVLFEKYFSPEEAIVFDGGPEVGVAFCSLPLDHLLFTGAPSIAPHIMRAAAENLVPVTLELGGKSPTILGNGADLQLAVTRIIAGKLMNAGQTCLAPDYLCVPREQVAEVVEIIKQVTDRLYPDMLGGNDDYTAIINPRHHARLTGYLAQAIEQGTEVVEVNPGNHSGERSDRMIPLNLLMDPSDNLDVMKDEIFGPLLPIKPYDSIDEVIHYVQYQPRPLALYYFGNDEAEIQALLDRTISGGVCINDVIMHCSEHDMPFGGVGASGMGAYHGIFGFREFSHAKSVLTQSTQDILAMLRTPYSAEVKGYLKMKVETQQA